jgi:hypothetical protein
VVVKEERDMEMSYYFLFGRELELFLALLEAAFALTTLSFLATGSSSGSMGTIGTIGTVGEKGD